MKLEVPGCIQALVLSKGGFVATARDGDAVELTSVPDSTTLPWASHLISEIHFPICKMRRISPWLGVS